MCIKRRNHCGVTEKETGTDDVAFGLLPVYRLGRRTIILQPVIFTYRSRGMVITVRFLRRIRRARRSLILFTNYYYTDVVEYPTYDEDDDQLSGDPNFLARYKR